MLPTPDEQTDSLSLENLSPRNFDTKHNNQFCLHFKRGKRPELKQSNGRKSLPKIELTLDPLHEDTPAKSRMNRVSQNTLTGGFPTSGKKEDSKSPSRMYA